jgi:hypothetical protein
MLSVVFPEAVFLGILGTCSFPAKHDVGCKTIRNLVPGYDRARTQLDKKYCHCSITVYNLNKHLHLTKEAGIHP